MIYNIQVEVNRQLLLHKVKIKTERKLRNDFLQKKKKKDYKLKIIFYNKLSLNGNTGHVTEQKEKEFSFNTNRSQLNVTYFSSLTYFWSWMQEEDDLLLTESVNNCKSYVVIIVNRKFGFLEFRHHGDT